MGPNITIFGISIPMPFRILHAVTAGNFRMPWRLAPIFVAGSAVFIAQTWTPILFATRSNVNTAPVNSVQTRTFRTLALVVVILLTALDIQSIKQDRSNPFCNRTSFILTSGMSRANHMMTRWYWKCQLAQARVKSCRGYAPDSISVLWNDTS